MTIHPLRAAERHLRTYPLDRGIIHRARLAIVSSIWNDGFRAGWQARDGICTVDVPPPPPQLPTGAAPTDSTPGDYAI
jgi:hypothetical protein